ncbi:MAG TPA: hypothetical protein VGH74_07815 [Planctomycetaceae bacterium]|jgi:hypothetical protein
MGSNASGADGSGAGMDSLWSSLKDRFGSGADASAVASPFTSDGGAASQFTMPGGQQANYQGVQMQPAALGGIQGVQDAQDWTQAMKDAGGGPNWGALAGAAGKTGGLDQQTPPHAPAGARPGSGQPINFVPQQTSMMAQPAGLTAATGQQNLLQMLAGQKFGGIPR